MQRLYLKFPTYKDKDDILKFKEEFISSGQKMAGVGGLDKMEFDEWFEKIISERNKATCGETLFRAKTSRCFLTFSLKKKYF